MGHATLWMEIDGVHILTDPVNKVIWGNAHFKSYFPEIKDRFPLDLVIVSHSHRDHFDPRALENIDSHIFIIPTGCFRLFPKRKSSIVVEMKAGESLEFKGIKISSLPTLHLSWLHPYLIFTPTLSYVLESSSGSIYFAGDTGFSERLFKGIGQSFKIDVAFLPVGPDAFFFRLYHLGARNAIRASRLLGAKVFVPIHWGIIKGTSGDSAKTVRRLLKLSPQSLRLLNVGDRVSWVELLKGSDIRSPHSLSSLK